ncbi:MAG TPA: hypothetical protein VEZ14_02220 [Dehalococcoidia bacterium]|nr:hypothetical protein [Dehalococcoidia bacterium]
MQVRRNGGDAAAGGGRASLAIWAAVSLAALAPIFLIWIPPWYDYHNWVFQGRILADLAGHGPDAASAIRGSYSLAWWPVPNLATPLGIALLTAFVPSDVAGRIFLAISVLGFAYGYAYLVRSVQRRPTALEFLAVPFAFGYFFYKGYTSYLVALPLAFVAIGQVHRISLRERPDPTRGEIALLAALGAGQYLSHLLGWGVFMVVLAVYGLDLVARGHRWSAIRLWCSAVPAVAMLAVYAAVRQHEHNTSVILYAHMGLSNDKVISLAEPLMLFLRADPFPALVPVFWTNLVVLLALGGIVAANVDWRRSPSRPLLASGMALAFCALVIPFAAFSDLSRPDERFVLPAALIVVAALGIRSLTVVRGAGIAVVILLVIALHVVEDRRVSNATAQIEQATAATLPAGSRVLALTISDGPTHGGCSTTAYEPSIGAAALRWLDLRWLVGTPIRNATLLETSMLHQRSSALAAPGLTTDVVPRSAIRSETGLAARYARSYDYVEVFGCPEALTEVRTAFAGAYGLVTLGNYYEILRDRTPPAATAPVS